MKFLLIVAALLACLFFFSAHAIAALPETRSSPNTTNEGTAIDAMRFAGIFTNTQVGVSGNITIDLTINADDTIEGHVDFSQFSGGQFACGSGEFEGTKEGESIELHFTSDSADPQCGFYQDVSFTIEAALLNNTIIQGEYTTDTGQEGVVDLRLISPSSGVFMPLVST
jgi:hypothetical protein